MRAAALRWLKQHHGDVSGVICCSKLYLPQESWTKRHTWWLEPSYEKIKESRDVHILCQTEKDSPNFHYLKVPSSFFQEKIRVLDVRSDNRISLFLSAEPNNLFVDERGKGNVNFSGFVVKGN